MLIIVKDIWALKGALKTKKNEHIVPKLPSKFGDNLVNNNNSRDIADIELLWAVV